METLINNHNLELNNLNLNYLIKILEECEAKAGGNFVLNKENFQEYNKSIIDFIKNLNNEFSVDINCSPWLYKLTQEMRQIVSNSNYNNNSKIYTREDLIAAKEQGRKEGYAKREKNENIFEDLSENFVDFL